ncbi:MAG TPA: hypothetical protein PLR75_01545 [Candidatus Pacearchaeota archaeon]|nr:hypothetical protein [Candidatus Pacearchaeota archaeon]
MPEDVLETLTRIAKDNERIARMIRDYFGTVFSALKLQKEIWGIEDSMKTLQLRVGGMVLSAKATNGMRLDALGDMKEQLEHYHDSIGCEHGRIVDQLDQNLEKLDLARAGLESDSPEFDALTEVIQRFGAFAWAIKDSRADMADLFAVPDVVAIYQEVYQQAIEILKQ